MHEFDTSQTKSRFNEQIDPATRRIELILNTNDPYKILDLRRDAKEEEIKKSFRKLSLQIHPDRCKHKNSEKAFKKMQNAKEQLLKPKTYFNESRNYTRDRSFDNDIFDFIHRNNRHSHFYTYSYYHNPDIFDFFREEYARSRFSTRRTSPFGWNTHVEVENRENQEMQKFFVFLILFIVFILLYS